MKYIFLLYAAQDCTKVENEQPSKQPLEMHSDRSEICLGALPREFKMPPCFFTIFVAIPSSHCLPYWTCETISRSVSTDNR